MLADCHVHPAYSIDAKGTLDEYCRAALDLGLGEICFTTHYDADPTRMEREGVIVIDGRPEKLTDQAVKHYFDDVARVHEEYGAGLIVRAGMEFGYFPGCEPLIADVQGKFPLSYRLGAVHQVGDLCVCCREEAPRLYASLTLTQLADRYFELLDRCAATGLFDCLAHIDVYRRYGLAHYGPEIDTIHRGRIEKVFETMLQHQVGFELNTSGIRHGIGDYYPAMEIINLSREMGVPLMSMGSDAHHPSQLALDFDAAAATAYELTPYVDE
jgi:histidinol-phosphatase (PHP family)